MPLLDHILDNLRASEKSSLCALYFTKESHIHTLLNLILASDLPFVLHQMPPLDYFSSITFEVFEKTAAPGPSSTGASPRESAVAAAPDACGSGSILAPDNQSALGSTDAAAPTASSGRASSAGSTAGRTAPMRSLLISVSEGAHSSNILSVNLDARHALTPLPRRPLTGHVDLDEALGKLSAHAQTLDHLDTSIERGQVEGSTVFFGEQESETGLLPVKQRRSSTDTDQTANGA